MMVNPEPLEVWVYQEKRVSPAPLALGGHLDNKADQENQVFLV